MARAIKPPLVREFAVKRPEVRLLQNPGNRGKGYSVRHGILQAFGEVVLFTDADLSAPIEEAEGLFAAIAGGADIAIGSRWLERTRQTIRQPLYRQFFGRCFNAVTRAVMRLPSPTRNAALRPLRAKPPKPSFSSRPSSAGASIPRFSSLPLNAATGFRGARELGPRRAHADELPERWHENARRYRHRPLECPSWPLLEASGADSS